MNDLLQSLLQLQALTFGEKQDSSVETARNGLRAKIPAQILGHFDRLVARGKKGVAVVRNQVCTGCHMRVPIGAINTLRQGQDIQLCESCGRYLYLPPEAKSGSPEPAAAPKPEKKPRKSKTSAAVP